MPTRQPNAREMTAKTQVQLLAEADRGQLLLRQPFIGSIIMRMDIVPVCDSRLQTAATDATNIFLDCAFYSSLNREERIFLLAHEVWHCVFLHFARRQQRQLERWNVAADLEIQFAMQTEHMKNPHPLSFPNKWVDLSAEEIYEKLNSAAVRDLALDQHLDVDSLRDDDFSVPSQGKNGKKTRTGPSSSHRPETDPAEEQQAEDQAQTQKQQAEAPAPAKGRQAEDQAQTEKQQAEAPAPAKGRQAEASASGEAQVIVIDPDYAPFFVPGIVERTRGRVVSAARQVERMQGHLPGCLNRLLSEMLDPRLRWQELLAQFVTSCYAGKRRWLPPSRRHVGQGLYLPSLRGERLKAVVALDTSGSTLDEVPQFFAELNALLGSFGDYELTVIQCDAAIQDVSTFSQASPCPGEYLKKAKGMGGTDFRPVFKYLARHPEIDHSLLIYFTDGYGTAPANPPHYPVLWILCRDSTRPAQWGTVVHLHDPDPNRRSS